MGQMKPWEIPDAPPTEGQMPWDIQDGQPGYGEDMAKGFGAGVVQGAIGIPGGFGTANDINQDLIKGAGDYLGAPEWLSSGVSKGARFLMPFGGLPGTKKLTDMVESVTGPLYEAQTVPGQYAQTMGQFVPGIAMGPGSIGQKAASGVSSALLSETAGQATKGSDIEPYARLGGALIGGVAPDVARRAVTPLPIPKERKALLGTLADEGVDLTAGQKTGSKPLQYLEAELGGGKSAAIMEKQGEQFTAAAAKKAGIDANRLSPEVMDEAFTTIGDKFDSLISRTAVPVDSKMQDDLLAAVTDYQSVSAQPARAAEDIMNRVSELAAKNGGILDGAAYKQISSDLARIMRSAKDPALVEALRNMKSALDDGVERGLSGDLLNEWRTARNQYRNLIVLEKGMSGAGAGENLISPQKLRSAAVQKHGARNFVRGKSDFTDLAKAGEAGMTPLPNSGTAGRLKAQQIGAGMMTLLGSLAGSGAGPMGTVAGGLLGMATPYAAGRALMSKPMQAYLSNQLFSGQGLPFAQKAVVPLLGVSPRITGPR